MTGDDRPTLEFAALTALDFDTEALLEVLADPRRWGVIACLEKYRTPMTLADMADEIAIWKHEKALTDIPPEDVKSVYVDLYHHDIPLLERAELVTYSQEQDMVTPTERIDDLCAYLGLPDL